MVAEVASWGCTSWTASPNRETENKNRNTGNGIRRFIIQPHFHLQHHCIQNFPNSVINWGISVQVTKATGGICHPNHHILKHLFKCFANLKCSVLLEFYRLGDRLLELFWTHTHDNFWTTVLNICEISNVKKKLLLSVVCNTNLTGLKTPLWNPPHPLFLSFS